MGKMALKYQLLRTNLQVFVLLMNIVIYLHLIVLQFNKFEKNITTALLVNNGEAKEVNLLNSHWRQSKEKSY